MPISYKPLEVAALIHEVDMKEYERKLFGGKCPYTDQPCDNDDDCQDCEVEKQEREFMKAIEDGE